MRRLAFLLIVSFALPLCADNAALESQLKAELLGKRFFVAGFQKGVKLSFDSAGKLDGRPRAGAWTEGALVEVEKVEVRNDRVEVQGRRKLIGFQPTRAGCEARERPLDVWSQYCIPEPRTATGDVVSIRVARNPSSTDQQVIEAITRVLKDSSASIVDLVPQYWKLFTCRMEAKNLGQDDAACWKDLHVTKPAVSDLEQNKGLLLVNGERIPASQGKPPKVISAPDPEYSEVARQHRFHGTSVWTMVVDESGVPRDLHIIRPCGMGLDEKAYEKLQTWRFKPALRNGKPVAVLINVEVNFRLYE